MCDLLMHASLYYNIQSFAFEICMQGLANNSMLKVGSCVPKEIIVVVRPKNLTMKKRGQVSRADPNVILPDELEMSLEVKLFDFAPPHAKISKTGKNAKVVYSGTTKAITKQKVGGLYCFSTEGNTLEHLFTQIGTYMFNFSLVSSRSFSLTHCAQLVNCVKTIIVFNHIDCRLCSLVCTNRSKLKVMEVYMLNNQEIGLILLRVAFLWSMRFTNNESDHYQHMSPRQRTCIRVRSYNLPKR